MGGVSSLGVVPLVIVPLGTMTSLHTPASSGKRVGATGPFLALLGMWPAWASVFWYVKHPSS